MPRINPAIIPTKCAIFATLPKPKIFNTPVKPIKSQINIKMYKAFGKSYLCPPLSKSRIKQ
jgi:hypothetical protein